MKRSGGIIGVIPARAGSRRLPGKNLRPLAGRPMIDWTLDAARSAASLDAVVVTSDDPGVLERAQAFGVLAVTRPPELSGDDAPVAAAVLHALATLGGCWTEVALLQPTSPLRIAADIDGAADLLRAESADALVSVSPPIKPTSFHRRIQDGRMQPLEASDTLVLINGAVYVRSVAALVAGCAFSPAGALAYVMPAERSWDVDTVEEFAACEALLSLRGHAFTTDRGSSAVTSEPRSP